MRDKRREELVEQVLVLKREVKKWKTILEEAAIKYQEQVEENQMLKECIVELKHQLTRQQAFTQRLTGSPGKMGHH